MTAIALIHGFLHEKQKSKPEWGSITVTETVLIETTSPSIKQIAILDELPASPNTVTATNPKGISFTFDLSEHPESNALILRSAGELKQVEQGGVFWEIELNYAIFSIWELAGPASGSYNSPNKRKDQRTTNPYTRPVVWNSSTNIVQKETYTKADGSGPILHTNGLPITKPFKYSRVHEIHNFSYNTVYSSFNYDDYRPYIGKVSNGITMGRAAGTLKFSSLSCSEEYESIGDGVNKVEYHYVRTTLSFEYNPDGWINDAKVVSMSTVQLQQLILFPFTVYYAGIKISATEYAKEPWPLTSTGSAIPYNDNDPNDYGYVNHGYPLQANLSDITSIRTLFIP